MEIILTDAAVQSLRQTLSDDEALWIHYDSEGCGCAVSGVAALSVLSREHLPQEPYIEAKLSHFPFEHPVIILERHTVFFDDQMTLDYRPDTRGYQLKSNGQIYANDLSLRKISDA